MALQAPDGLTIYSQGPSVIDAFSAKYGQYMEAGWVYEHSWAIGSTPGFSQPPTVLQQQMGSSYTGVFPNQQPYVGAGQQTSGGTQGTQQTPGGTAGATSEAQAQIDTIAGRLRKDGPLIAGLIIGGFLVVKSGIFQR